MGSLLFYREELRASLVETILYVAGDYSYGIYVYIYIGIYWK